MLRIEFNSESINQFLQESLNKPVSIHNSFLDMDDSLEKLNSLKTEFAYVLKEFSSTNSTAVLEVFEHLQAGEYFLLDEAGNLVYEGISFESNRPINIPSTHEEGESLEMENMDLVDLIERRKLLQEDLVQVNAHIVNNLTGSLDLFDDVIERLDSLKGTWAERIDAMLSVAGEIEKEDITAFSNMILALKAIQDKLSSEIF